MFIFQNPGPRYGFYTDDDDDTGEALAVADSNEVFIMHMLPDDTLRRSTKH